MASIGAAAATALAPRATTAPDSFLELWADRGDALEGNHEALCEKWTSDLTEAQCHKATLELDPSAGPPKAMMVLAAERPVGAAVHGPAKVHLLFNMESFPTDPSNPSPHDAKACAFSTDKAPGTLHIGSVEHPSGIGAKLDITV